MSETMLNISLLFGFRYTVHHRLCSGWIRKTWGQISSSQKVTVGITKTNLVFNIQ